MKIQIKHVLLVFIAIIAVNTTKAQKSVKIGDRYYKKFDFYNAIEEYKTAISNNPENLLAIKGLAASYRHISKFEESEYWYGKLVDLDSGNPENQFYYSQALRSTKKYDKALSAWTTYKSNTSSNYVVGIIDGFEEISRLSIPNPNVDLKNAEALNTDASDFGVGFKSGSEITFCSTRSESKGVEDNWTHQKYTDLYYSTVSYDGQSGPVKFDDEQYNGIYHDGPAAFNGNTMYLTRSQYNKTRAYKSKADKTVNLELVEVDLNVDSKKLKKYGDILEFNNKEYSVGHAAVSPDGTKIVFSSDSKEFGQNLGGTDLFMITKSGESWSTPVNLGSTINTPADEEYPFFLSNSELYFASDGHYGLGGLDIYNSMFKNNEWSTPTNIGAPFNTSFDDYNLVYDKTSNVGFISSNRTGGKGSDDIYVYKFKDGVNLSGTPLLKVLTYDAETLQPLEHVTLDLSKCKELQEQSNSSGRASLSVDAYSTCLLKANLDGYFPKEVPFSIFAKDLDLEIPLYKYNPDEIIQLEVCVYERRSNKAISGADVKVVDSRTKEILTGVTDESGCTFFEVIAPDNCYDIVGSKKVEKPNEMYLTTTDQVCTYNVDAPAVVQKLLYLDHVTLGQPIVGSLEGRTLPNGIVLPIIYYDLDKFNIRRDAAEELNALVKIMKDNPTLQIQAASYTDCRRDYDYNMTLSKNRAIEAVDYLVENGISRSRLTWANYGESKPVNNCNCECDQSIKSIGLAKFRDCEDAQVTNCTEEDHQLNRRTEFIVTKF